MEYGPVKSPNANVETGYFRRVHEIAEYLVPIKYAANYIGDSRLPLIQAAGQGDLHWVRQILLNTDTDPDTRSFQGWTALQQVCSINTDAPQSRDQEAIVRLLISQGADVNAARGNGYGRTALQAACETGNEKIVDLLLEKGADVNEDVGSLGGKSSLACAVWAGHLGIVKKLLNLGADINQPGSEELGHIALSAAAQLNNLEMLDFLIANGARTQGSDALFALKKALYYDSLDTARRLLEQGLDVNSCANGSAPLHAVDSVDMLNLVVSYGARFDLHGSEASEGTALQSAARWGSLDLVTELVRLGSDVHHPGARKYGRSALQAAAAKFLVEKGAVITPFTLHVAAAQNHTELLDYLLRNGARIEDISSPAHISSIGEYTNNYCEFGPTVIETARFNDHMALAEALENWSPSNQLEMRTDEEDAN
jgi:ankyrin repeat protein